MTVPRTHGSIYISFEENSRSHLGVSYILFSSLHIIIFNNKNEKLLYAR